MVPFAITNSANCQVIAYDASRIARILCCACIVTNYSQKLGVQAPLLLSGIYLITHLILKRKPSFLFYFFLLENQQTAQYVQVFSSPAQFQHNGTTNHNVVFTNIQPSKVTGPIQLLRKLFKFCFLS